MRIIKDKVKQKRVCARLIKKRFFHLMHFLSDFFYYLSLKHIEFCFHWISARALLLLPACEHMHACTLYTVHANTCKYIQFIQCNYTINIHCLHIFYSFLFPCLSLALSLVQHHKNSSNSVPNRLPCPKKNRAFQQLMFCLLLGIDIHRHKHHIRTLSCTCSMHLNAKVLFINKN